MITNEERVFLKKRENHIIGFVQNQFRKLEQELCEQNASILKEMGFKLELKACELYGGYDKHLLTKRKLHGDGVDIVSMIFILLCEHTEYSHSEISSLYNKGKSSINNAKQSHRHKDKKIPHHKKYIEIYKELEEYFKTEVLNQNTQNYEPES